MKFHTLTFAAALAALAPALTGCVGEDLEPEVAYPEAPVVGSSAQAQAARPAQPGRGRVHAPQQQPSEAEEEDGTYGPAPAPGAGTEADEYDDTDPSALSDFRSTLDPYGQWVDDPTYGTIWVPSQTVVGNDFTPYVSGGHWAYDSDYTWVSDYSWGWAPFHYGRWAYSSPYGWGWIPGRTYAGAWVSWRYGVGDWGYVGWAPLGPTWGWRGGMAVGLGFVPAAPYCFVGSGALFAHNIAPHMITGAQAGVVGGNTRPYVGASPTVGGVPSSGRVAATPGVNGPPPQIMHIPASAVTHTSTSDRGVAQATAFAHPSTATALGAHGPAGYSASVASSARGSLSGRVPSYGSSSTASHFGGRLGSGFSASPSGRGYAQPSYGGSYGGRGSYGSAGSRSWSSGYSGGGYAGGGYRGAAHPGVGSQPSGSHSGESDGGGQYSPGYHRGSGVRSGGYHGGGFSGYSGGGGGRSSGGGGGSRGGGGHR